MQLSLLSCFEVLHLSSATLFGGLPAKQSSLIPIERIEKAIYFIRGEKVMLDRELPHLYGVSTKVLKQAVRRNIDRFPDDFMFQLTSEEKAEVVANCDHVRRLKFSPNLPHAFTEHGTIMAANVLNSERAVQASVEIVRAFIAGRGSGVALPGQH